MTKRTCLYCGTVFEDTYSFFTCATCKQTKAITKAIRQQQSYQAPPPGMPPLGPVYHYDSSKYDWSKSDYEPPTPEQARRRAIFYRIDQFLHFLFWCSPFFMAVIFWFITSGWYTLVAFGSIFFIMKWLYTQLWYWELRHSKDLF